MTNHVLGSIYTGGGPVFTTQPSISGTPQVGGVVIARVGNAYPIPTHNVFGFQWNVNGTPVSGATLPTYTPVTIGDVITVTVSGTNTGGSNSAVSNSVTAVAGPGVTTLSAGNLAAYMSSAATGAILYLQNGTYTCAGGVPKTNQTIRGQSRAGVILQGSTGNAFTGSASGVTIANLTVQGYRPTHLFGAIDQTTANGWKISNIHLTGISEEGIAMGPGCLLTSSLIDSCGNVGIGTGAVNGDATNPLTAFPGLIYTVENVEISGCGLLNSTDAGGIKFLWSNGATFTHMYVHDNNSFGIWGDAYNKNTNIQYCWVENAQFGGIFHEISYDCTIHHNTVIHCGIPFFAGNDTGGFTAGAGAINISEGSNSYIYNNTITNNHLGIIGYNGHGWNGWLRNMQVHNNVETNVNTFWGMSVTGSQPGAYSTSHFYSNTYASGQTFVWNGTYGLSYSQWAADGQS